jgi:hypothetical protein
MKAVDDDGTSTKISLLFDKIEALGHKHEGEFVSKCGDELIFLFDNAIDAGRLGMQVQDLLKSEC